MTIRRFYQISLLVPILVLLSMAMAGFDFRGVSGLFEPASPRSDTALLGVPYLGLVYFALRRMRRISEPEIVMLSLQAPFVFAGLACLWSLPVVGVNALTGGSSVLEAGGMLLGVGLLALLAAAEYVLLANGVLFLCCKARLVRHETRVSFL